jgi:dsRNA-specific ribonuclease
MMSSTRVLTYIRRAMRHKSSARDNTNERLEYLGDSVIALTTYHVTSYKDQNEGFLTRLRMQLVSGDNFRKLAVEIDFRAG